MSPINADIVARALRDSLDNLAASEGKGGWSIDPQQNLLEVVDSFGFAELILNLEARLDVELPLDQVDLAAIVQVDRLIDFVCEHG